VHVQFWQLQLAMFGAAERKLTAISEAPKKPNNFFMFFLLLLLKKFLKKLFQVMFATNTIAST
jgi:hypothetical protein